MALTNVPVRTSASEGKGVSVLLKGITVCPIMPEAVFYRGASMTTQEANELLVKSIYDFDLENLKLAYDNGADINYDPSIIWIKKYKFFN